MFSALTRPERVKVLVLDDSVVKRNRSKAVELLARVYDHVEHKYRKEFTMLTLGWSDGYSFVSVGFNLLSSAKKSNRYQEIQSRTYDAMASHTAIVFIRYTILEWIRRKENDEKTYGDIFFMLCEDIQDMDLTNALQGLMALFVEHISVLSADITAYIKSKVTEWMNSQAAFIQTLFENIC